ncbi:beta-galactosidase [Mariniflexile soesokkakense]|uniref:Beta-galactosidase n=1 Tax=Mariniflexile soesokkakense TaxID=1343160 RepID=A0ABV0AD33_9FLAO
MALYFRLIITALLLTSTSSYCQKIKIDARINVPKPIEGTLKMGHSGSKGKEITINNKFLSLAGKPILPVMGEIHFSRCNPDKWEDLILKMKANGITIISTYVFWIHHEEEQGVFDWSGNKNLRRFIELCKKHDVWAYPRIGPWCHGEVRNGGLPDWIVNQNDFKIRTNDIKYLEYVDKLYREIAEQLNGLYYKNNGPVIGIQLENEYWRGKSGEQHIMELKNTALKYGIDVPMYTITGWRNASTPENEVIPLWGGYPAAPWNTDIKKITTNESYLFNKPINDQSIGHKELSDKYQPDYVLYPYFTCELGIGNQISEHRRPILDPIDGVTIATSSVASGSNLPGYYVFAGGLNPVGKYTTLEEDRYESGYWNEYPNISYDFQAALRETGEISEAYQKLKPLHYFLAEFGEDLAPMAPIIPENNTNTDLLQYAFRVKNDSGFLFASNYYRGYTKSTKKEVQFNIQLNNETIKIPSIPINIEDKTVFIWPVNMAIGQNILKYATVQPICNVKSENTKDWYFKETNAIDAEFLFASKKIKSIHVNGKNISKSGDEFLLKNIELGLKNPIIIKNTDATIQRIFVLSENQVDNFWHFKSKNQTHAFLSSANLIMDENNQLHAFSIHKTDTVVSLNNSQLNTTKKTKEKTINGFKHYSLQNIEKKMVYTVEKADLINEAKWLQISADNYQEKNELYHKQFFKTFNLENTADIKKAVFHFLTDETCIIRINGKWLNQNIIAEKTNTLDFTGYVQKGKNTIILDFPYLRNKKACIGILEVEFYNADKVYIPTDISWETVEQYKIPAPWDVVGNTTEPIILPQKPKQYEKVLFSPNRYALKFDKNQIKVSKNVYLRIDYSGDKLQCYSGKNLVADNFNNDTTWSINLTDIKLEKEVPLIFEIEPFKKDFKIYFDKQPNLDKTAINSIKIEPEYLQVFEIKK